MIDSISLPLRDNWVYIKSGKEKIKKSLLHPERMHEQDEGSYQNLTMPARFPTSKAGIKYGCLSHMVQHFVTAAKIVFEVFSENGKGLPYNNST